MVTLDLMVSLPAAAMSTRPSRAASHRLAVPVAFVLAVAGIVGTREALASESWSVMSGDVRVRCRLTVGGSFDATTSSISGALQRTVGDSLSYAGELRVDLGTLDTGIGLRNDHLRTTYLETERGPDFRRAVLSGTVLDDPLPAGNRRHATRFAARLTLHGVEREIEGEAELRRRNGRVQVEATFSLSLEAFDIPPPRYLGIGVRDAVEVTVRFDAAHDETSSDGES